MFTALTVAASSDRLLSRVSPHCVRTQGLRLLHDGGMFYGQLHASNVIVDDGVCRLADVENGMLGVPSVLRPAFAQFRKINVSKEPHSS